MSTLKPRKIIVLFGGILSSEASCRYYSSFLTLKEHFAGFYSLNRNAAAPLFVLSVEGFPLEAKIEPQVEFIGK